MINISESGAPSDLAIQLNVDALARYASICQVDSPLVLCVVDTRRCRRE